MTSGELAIRLIERIEAGDEAGFQALADLPEARSATAGRDGRELLAHAVVKDLPAIVHALLQLGVDPNLMLRDWRGTDSITTNLVSMAMHRGRGQIAVELFRHGARPDQYYALNQVNVQANPSEAYPNSPAWTLAQGALRTPGVELRDLVRLMNAPSPRTTCAFTSAAIEAGRTDLAKQLLGQPGSIVWWRHDGYDSPLILSAQRGLSDLIGPLVNAGLSVNSSDSNRRTALHHAIRSGEVDPAARARTVRVLLENWAVPQLLDCDRANAYRMAEATGCARLREVLDEHGLRHGPQQSREARAAGVRDVCLTYDKADGIIYRIGIPDQPFLEGGDYDGCTPCSVEQAASAFERVRKGWPRIDWFAPFLEMLRAGREFPFSLMLGRAASVTFYAFDKPANWDY